VLHVLAALAAVSLVASCGENEGAESVTSEPSVLQGTIGEALGVDLMEISYRVESARFQILTDCLGDAGFSVREEPPPRLELMLPPSYAAGALELLESGQVRVRTWDDATGDAEEYQRAYGACTEEAAKRVPDPLGGLQEWLNLELQSVVDAVSADQRIVRAQGELQECLSSV